MCYERRLAISSFQVRKKVELERKRRFLRSWFSLLLIHNRSVIPSIPYTLCSQEDASQLILETKGNIRKAEKMREEMDWKCSEIEKEISSRTDDIRGKRKEIDDRRQELEEEVSVICVFLWGGFSSDVRMVAITGEVSQDRD